MAKRKRVSVLLSGMFCLLTAWGWGTERSPWVGNFLEFESRNSLIYQTYSLVDSSSHLIKHSADDFFLVTSLSNTIGSFSESIGQFGIEVEMMAANTHKQNWDIDHLRLTGRYVWFDELAGDPLTLTTGLSLTQSFYRALHDISSFHHGRSEAEIFLSFGKEQNEEEQWGSHWWGVIGVGFAERGKPWLQGELVYAHRFYMHHELSIFARSLWGMGYKPLNIKDFDGYGPVQHQSIDLGIHYTYLIDYFGSLRFEYSGRVYAYNFPAYAQHVLIRLLYTFGL